MQHISLGNIRSFTKFRERMKVGYYSNNTTMINFLRKNNIEIERDFPILNNDVEVMFYMDLNPTSVEYQKRIIEFDNLSYFKYHSMLANRKIPLDLNMGMSVRDIYMSGPGLIYPPTGIKIVKYLYSNDPEKDTNLVGFLTQAMTDNCSFAFELFQFMLENVGR